MCGENDTEEELTEVVKGSPTRMRGKSALKRVEDKTLGITPRVCGENTRRRAIAWKFWGSPPRMRGKQNGFCGSGTGRGITPACAGKTRPFVDNPFFALLTFPLV